jgi:hypothetical protein
VKGVDECLSCRTNTRRLAGTSGEHHLYVWTTLG